MCAKVASEVNPVWGRLATCSGLVIRLVQFQKIVGPITNRPQVTNLPHKSSGQYNKEVGGIP
jgi:hypothetical protein